MISNLAYIHPDAKLGANVTVEPFAYIAGDTVIGDDCWPISVVRVWLTLAIGNFFFFCFVVFYSFSYVLLRLSIIIRDWVRRPQDNECLSGLKALVYALGQRKLHGRCAAGGRGSSFRYVTEETSDAGGYTYGFDERGADGDRYVVIASASGDAKGGARGLMTLNG